MSSILKIKFNKILFLKILVNSNLVYFLINWICKCLFEKIVEYFSGTNKPYNTDTREFNVLNAQKVASLLNWSKSQKDSENNIPQSSKKTKDYMSSEIDEALAHLMKKTRMIQLIK